MNKYTKLQIQAKALMDAIIAETNSDFQSSENDAFVNSMKETLDEYIKAAITNQSAASLRWRLASVNLAKTAKVLRAQQITNKQSK